MMNFSDDMHCPRRDEFLEYYRAEEHLTAFNCHGRGSDCGLCEDLPSCNYPAAFRKVVAEFCAECDSAGDPDCRKANQF